MTLISPKVIARPREVRSLIDHSVGFFLGDTKAFNNIFYAESSWSFYIHAYGVVIVTQQVICTFSNDNAGLLLGKLLDGLNLVPVFGPYLVAGYAVLLFFVNNRPAHLFTEAVALSALHGDVGLAFIVIVHLLVGGHSIQTVNASSDKNVIFHIDPSFHLS